VAQLIFALLLLAAPLPALSDRDYQNQANQFYNQRDFSTSLDLYRKSKALNPSSGPSIWGEANSLYMLGRKQEALQAYREALAVMPGQAQLQLRIRQIEQELASIPAATPGPTASKRHWLQPLWRSALLPGWGQAYNGQSRKAWLVGGTAWASFGGVVGTYLGGQAALDQYQKASTAPEALEKYDQAYGYYLANQTFYLLFGFAYFYNVFDAALNFDAPLRSAGINPPLQVALMPDGVRLSKEWSW
jgi:tetratricopeptide (TPR) repeat protein